MSHNKTYRVKGIPGLFTREDSRRLLRSVLEGHNENVKPIINSLGPDPYAPDRSRFQIATVTFEQIPKCLQGTMNQWTFPVDKTLVSPITVDSHFSGFTPLNAVRDGPDHKIDCIAITGLGSHPFGSWKQRGGEHMWLRDGLPYDLKGVRVLSYGYDTNLFQSQTFQNVDDIAIAFSKSIRSIRRHSRGETMSRPLVFLSHSLGGVILKKAIVNMKEGDDIDKENFDSIYGVLFFGVPNQGIRIEHWLAMVKGQPNENLVRNLGPDSTYLRTLHEDFRAAFGFLDSEVVAIYETERTRVAKEEEPGKWKLTGDYEILVPISSATDGPPKDQYHVLPIKQNHSDMVKFSSRWDENYKLILSYLEEFTLRAPGVIAARFSKIQDPNTDIEPKDSEGWTPLHRAAFRGNEGSLKELLRLPINMEATDANGRTALHIGACHGHDAIAKTLLARGANKNARDYCGQTPLYNAASRGYRSAVRILVDERADMEATDNEQKTALYVAARHGHEDAVRLLLDRGANKEAKGNGGWTPLHAAAWYGHETVVRLLVDRGVDRESRSQGGHTPLHVAVQNGHETVVRLLATIGASNEARTDAGETPLHVAAHHGREAVARFLVDMASDKEAVDNDGRTPLYIAARAGQEKVTRLLLERGASWKVKALGGWTPLHAAAWYGRESTSKTLLDYGADLESRSEDGQTPLFAAARHGHEPVVRLLVQRGANRAAHADKGWTPLRVAEANGHRAVARLLRGSRR